jgi:hypothetical protein
MPAAKANMKSIKIKASFVRVQFIGPIEINELVLSTRRRDNSPVQLFGELIPPIQTLLRNIWDQSSGTGL